ncbi:MAG: hypothetical protein KGL39_47755 [Patescibacteria group bacterium]|nr:hypothetical protein [Patescibacteria group bacterium]
MIIPLIILVLAAALIGWACCLASALAEADYQQWRERCAEHQRAAAADQPVRPTENEFPGLHHKAAGDAVGEAVAGEPGLAASPLLCAGPAACRHHRPSQNL